MKAVGITGTGGCVPEKILTNKELEKMVDTTDEWIQTRTGIRQRHIADSDTATSDLAIGASRRALSSAGLDGSEIELIIVATITPDTPFPSTACIVQEKLGAANAVAFDIGAACSGFIYGLVTASRFLLSDSYNNALVIGGDTLSKITDWEDRNTCVLLGDGVGAVVLQEVEEPSGLLSFHMKVDGSKRELLWMPGGGSRNPISRQMIDKRLHYLKMRGNELFKVAVRCMVESAESALAGCGLSSSDVDLLIPHQANIRIINMVADRLGVPRSKVYVNIEKYGNTSAGTIGIAIDEAYREGRIKKGSIVVLDAFGSGLTWGACVFRWQ